jgi:hypothetical protein
MIKNPFESSGKEKTCPHKNEGKNREETNIIKDKKSLINKGDKNGNISINNI